MDLALRVAARYLRADLQPPLGDPGGPCQVIQRIEEEVPNPNLREHLIDEVEEGAQGCPTHLRVAYRYLESVFLPDKWFRSKKTELRKLLANPASKEPWEVGEQIRNKLIPFYETFMDEFPVHDYARVSIKERASTVVHVLNKIADGYYEFDKAVRDHTWPATNAKEDLVWWISTSIKDLASEKVKTLGDALKRIPRTSPRLIEMRANSVLKKATPEEGWAIEDARKEDFGPASKKKWEFYQRINLDALIKRTFSWEKVNFDYVKWINRTWDTLAFNYTQTDLERVDGFQEFNFGDMKVVIVDPEISIFENSWYVRRVREAQALIQQKGFSKLWRGVLFVLSKNYQKLTPTDQAAYAELGYKTLEETAGTYHSGADVIKITSPAQASLTNTIVHELGHRYWYKVMDPEQRARFNGLVRTNPSEKTRDYPSGPTEDGVEKPVTPVSDYGASTIEEAFAEVFERYVTEREMNRDQLESFRSVLKTAAGEHARSIALMKFLSKATKQLGLAEHVYVVGGAVRNFLIDQPIKDIDIVIDAIRAKKDSEWLAKKLQQAIPVATNLTTNQYGVAILTIKGEWQLDGHDMKGEVIEIANARKESYGGESGKGYKPHMVEPATIEEDLVRREFTFNSLLWRLLDLEHGPDRAEVIDLLGVGKKHLEERELRTPVDPDKTFSDDPTRMLRAIKFVAKYGFKIPPDVVASIRKNAPKLKQMPWDAVRKILVEDILEGPAPRASVKLMHDLGLGEVLKEMLHEESGFASALGRSLNDVEVHLVLDLLDLGWVMRTPIGFLDRPGQLRLREILLENASTPGWERNFVQALQKPPVDQQRLFTEYAIPPKERGVVVQEARRLLLSNPELHYGNDVEKPLEAILAVKYPKAGMAEKVAARFARVT